VVLIVTTRVYSGLSLLICTLFLFMTAGFLLALAAASASFLALAPASLLELSAAANSANCWLV
jgi:hypothetical protein